MAKRKRSTARSKASSEKVGRRRRSAPTSTASITRPLTKIVLPLFISLSLIAALAVIGMSGYQTATNSPFFHLQGVEIRGAQQTPAEDIRRIVAAEVEKPGVWNVDLAELRTKIEKFPYVKAAAVSRMLPNGIRVDITERVPAAIVHLKSGDFLIDGEGAILSSATGREQEFPFVLYGWDEGKTEKAPADNLARLKLYRKMLDEWQQFDLASRVKHVDLSDLKEPAAIIEDSGHPISVFVAKDNLGKSLKTAIEAVSGKGSRVKSVNAGGVYPIIQYLDF
jgi:cell division protein FtsQ